MGWSENSNMSSSGSQTLSSIGEGGEWPPNPSHVNHTVSANNTVLARPDVLGPEYHEQLRMGILGVMFLVALLGNSKVMWTLRQKWENRGRMTILSFNLTLADTLVTLITILGQLLWEVLDKHWYLSNGACKVYKVASTFAITSSNYMLVAIAIDRHEAVVRPLNPFISAKNLVLAAWAVSLLPSLPNLFIFLRHTTPEGRTYCVSKFYTQELDTNFRQVYLMVVLVLVFIICQVLLLVLYVRIYFTIWRKSSYFRGGQRGNNNDSQRSNSLLPKAKTKTLNMTIVIVATFFVTNTPYVVQELLIAFGNMDNINPNVVALFGIISASNSSLNPFIYLLFCPKAERRSPESYRVTFSRRWPTLNSRHLSTPASAQTFLTSGNSCKSSN
ncbi:cardioacceleratory peptide receptor-like isoform X1 [Scylla paramamosain]|uniref:cardioacceleratory peptide receptor-like isoform X1 n=1 Tax=Scylla paramamosain TaxID=85552 RepID=UPI003082A64E